jgi:hypothetical protein
MNPRQKSIPVAVAVALLAAATSGIVNWRHRQAVDERRAAVVTAARAELGKSDWTVYARETTGAVPPKRPEWCGMFALAMLRRAGLAPTWQWEYGRGFLYRLPVTDQPQPADMAYYDQPYQHHAIVVALDAGTVDQVQGNGAGGKVTESWVPAAKARFYSIEPLTEK